MMLNSKKNGLLGFLIATNFVEIKSNVFKHWNVERIRKLVGGRVIYWKCFKGLSDDSRQTTSSCIPGGCMGWSVWLRNVNSCMSLAHPQVWGDVVERFQLLCILAFVVIEDMDSGATWVPR